MLEMGGKACSFLFRERLPESAIFKPLLLRTGERKDERAVFLCLEKEEIILAQLQHHPFPLGFCLQTFSPNWKVDMFPRVRTFFPGADSEMRICFMRD